MSIYLRAGGIADLANSSGRIVRYRFSTPKVARDDHTIAGWQLTNYRKNPVFLWAHDSRGLPIGKVLDDLADNGGYLDGSVEYAERDVYPFADTVLQLVRGGYISAVSTSWDPLKWKPASDRSRPGGIDFEMVDLLELSQVPVPAVPEALATARSNGIDTGPMFDWASRVLDEGGLVAISRAELEAVRREAKMPAAGKTSKTRADADWKIGTSRNLPLDAEAAWDGPAAAASIFEKAGFDGDSPDVAFARKGFLLYDASAPTEKGSYRLPFAKIVDGRLTAVASGIRAASSRLPQTDIPKDVVAAAREVISHYEDKIGSGKDGSKSAEQRGAILQAFKRDLYQVAWLAFLLSDLDCIETSVQWEAAIEEDGSTIPAQLAEAKKMLGAILVAMAGEEVAEMNSEEELDRSIDDKTVRAVKCAMLGAMRGLKDHDAIDAAIQTIWARGLQRAGKVLSSANEKTLRDAHEMMTRGCDMVRGVFEQAAPVADDDSDGDVERAIRERRAKARKRKLALV